MHVWTYPVETVSQSEAGFELVHQSVVVHPHWYIKAASDGRFATTMTLAIDTSMAEKRQTFDELITTV
jgi:alpha-amylase